MVNNQDEKLLTFDSNEFKNRKSFQSVFKLGDYPIFKLSLIVASILFIVGLFVLVYLHVQITEYDYQIQEVEEEIITIEKELDQTETHVNELLSYERLKQILNEYRLDFRDNVIIIED